MRNVIKDDDFQENPQCVINIDNKYPHINYYEYDEYGNDIIIEEPKINKFVLFCYKVRRFFRNLFCKCLIKKM